MMNHEEIFFSFFLSFSSPSLSVFLSLFLSLPILYVIFNELLCAPCAPLSTPILQLLPLFFFLSFSSFPFYLLLSLPFYSVHPYLSSIPPSLPPSPTVSLFSMYITVYSLGGSPGGIYGNRIARQQPFPFLSCAVQQRQQSTNPKLRKNAGVREKFRTHTEGLACSLFYMCTSLTCNNITYMYIMSWHQRTGN